MPRKSVPILLIMLVSIICWRASGSSYTHGSLSPARKYVMNVYVYERDTDSIQPITHNLRTNSVYPTYFKDGRLLYLNHATDPMTKKRETTFTIADPSRAPSLPLGFLRSRMEDPKQERRFHAIVALGSLWSYHCSEFGSQVSATAAALRALSVDSMLCRQRVI